VKAIILAGGSGSRLYPLTLAVNKHLLPINDKPMIYYPLSVIMLAGIRDVLIVTNPNSLSQIKLLLGNGEEFGIKISYKVQENPGGIAEAIGLSVDFIGINDFALILGDNIFFGNGFKSLLIEAMNNLTLDKSTIFGYYVNNPSDYGIVSIYKNGRIKDIVEKPLEPISNIAIPGLYFYKNRILNHLPRLKRSDRGELEVSDLNRILLNEEELELIRLGRGFAWFDAGSFENLFESTNLIRSVEKRQNLKIGSVHEVAYFNGWISKQELQNIINRSSSNEYFKYLSELLNE